MPTMSGTTYTRRGMYKMYQMRMVSMLHKLKIFFLRLFCLHKWETDYSIGRYLNGLVVYGQGILKSWICIKCGKQVYSYIEPISYYIKE